MSLIKQINEESQPTAGFKLEQHDEGAGDTLRIFHVITDPTGKQHLLDHNQREYLDKDTFEDYVTYFKKHGKFPRRTDLGLGLSLRSSDIARAAKAE